MHAVMVPAFGGPEVLAVVELPDPNPAAGQVSITTEAIGVGGVDALIRSGALAAYGATPGRIPGQEVAGTVTEVGEGVDTAWIGQRVWAFTGEDGGYTERAVASAETLVPLPEMVVAFRKSMSFATFSADTVPAPDRRAATAELFAAAASGELEAVVHETLSLEQAVLAHQKMEAGEVFGRIVLTPSAR
ncbi:alcohol dehydrogenase catalytic domain-containing protein [Nocardia sp. NPDC059246]|uniref:alcohol dehydrogenase catalytic domain-containing protein n=1 Tax=unclassified Nocardia TaxID=2637762 RepID=UPI0036A88F30